MTYLEVFTGASVTEVGGGLRLEALPSWQADIRLGLARVGGDVTISGTGLLAVDGTGLVTQIPGGLQIADNDGLERVTGFDSLVRVERELRVAANPHQTVLSGFSGLREIGLSGDAEDETDTLRLGFLPALVTLDAFGALEHVGAVSVLGLDALPRLDLPVLHTVERDLMLRASGLDQLDGFGALIHIGGSIALTGLNELSLVDGFGGLDGIGGDLELARSARLVTVSGFDRVTAVAGSLVLEDQAVLAVVVGLDAIEQVGGDLVIRDNPSLLLETVDAMVARIETAGDVVVEGNGG
ncbi:MAG: hypothetical protein GY884_19725 [Proteobacteria bacterium]|nr:hypothetical protein [Pseudomonadota bacterium]